VCVCAASRVSRNAPLRYVVSQTDVCICSIFTFLGRLLDVLVSPALGKLSASASVTVAPTWRAGMWQSAGHVVEPRAERDSLAVPLPSEIMCNQ